MSDLAPLVAACIRDNVVQDLYEENKALRNSFDNVRITGSSGVPLYATSEDVKKTLPFVDELDNELLSRKLFFVLNLLRICSTWKSTLALTKNPCLLASGKCPESGPNAKMNMSDIFNSILGIGGMAILTRNCQSRRGLTLIPANSPRPLAFASSSVREVKAMKFVFARTSNS